MNFFSTFLHDFLGQIGVVIVIGLIVFTFSYSKSISIIDWVERNTLGTRNYILEKLELLFLEIKAERITLILLSLSFGLGSLTFIAFSFIASWKVGLIMGLFLGFLGWKAPKPIIHWFIERRTRVYAEQMVDGLTLLANGLRAGLSMPQSLAMVVDELNPPIAQEFQLILQQNKVGMPLNECFDNLAKRIPTEDNQMFVTSVNILDEIGGNLPETFMTITEVIRERQRLQQKINALTAQSKTQAMVIGFMPALLGVYFAIENPDSMVAVFNSTIGVALIILSLLLSIAGYIVIVKMSKIKA